MKLLNIFKPLFLLLFVSLSANAETPLPLEPWLTANAAGHWLGVLGIQNPGGIPPGRYQGFGPRLSSADVYYNSSKYAAYVKNHALPSPYYSYAVTDQYWGSTYQAFYTPVHSRQAAKDICYSMNAKLAELGKSPGVTSRGYWNKFIAPMAEKKPNPAYARAFALDVYGVRGDPYLYSGEKFYYPNNAQTITGFENDYYTFKQTLTPVYSINYRDLYNNLLPAITASWTYTNKQGANVTIGPNNPGSGDYFIYYISRPDNSTYDGTEVTKYLHALRHSDENSYASETDLTFTQYPICQWSANQPINWWNDVINL